ncbi:hypothetical protein [Acidithiobacillus ferriphilus]|uniref:hypothetical protein n=1 Tax=Acidithiobacillus ferriphilus TaxID=1689834 RepID=UPI001C07B1B5|nr:hypothetical protein [Acidithiobacillus ferriphilus]MBU2830921.1 hypothetical protein [Acidithiobacillus ferriphilus]
MAAIISETTHEESLSKAQEALTRLVENGDLERIVHLARLAGAAQDSMSDEIVGRLAGLASDGLDLLDRINRSQIVHALPTLSVLLENGDLERIVHLARMVGAAQDSMSDEMLTRMAGMASDAMCLLDRATRTGVMDRLLAVAEKMDQEHILTDFLCCLTGATEEAAHTPAPKGGISGLWDLMKQPETQQTIQFLMLLGKHFRSCRLKP